MNRVGNRYGAAILFAAVVLVGIGLMGYLQPASVKANKEEKPAMNCAHYSVIETEGHNVIVTDNATNTVYFYTVDKGEPVGSDLKLRGTLDLNEVGKPVLKPKAINIQK